MRRNTLNATYSKGSPLRKGSSASLLVFGSDAKPHLGSPQEVTRRGTIVPRRRHRYLGTRYIHSLLGTGRKSLVAITELTTAMTEDLRMVPINDRESSARPSTSIFSGFTLLLVLSG